MTPRALGAQERAGTESTSGKEQGCFLSGQRQQLGAELGASKGQTPLPVPTADRLEPQRLPWGALGYPLPLPAPCWCPAGHPPHVFVKFVTMRAKTNVCE